MRIHGSYLCGVAEMQAFRVLAANDGDDEEDEDEERRHYDQEEEDKEEETFGQALSVNAVRE